MSWMEWCFSVLSISKKMLHLEHTVQIHLYFILQPNHLLNHYNSSSQCLTFPSHFYVALSLSQDFLLLRQTKLPNSFQGILPHWLHPSLLMSPELYLHYLVLNDRQDTRLSQFWTKTVFYHQQICFYHVYRSYIKTSCIKKLGRPFLLLWTDITHSPFFSKFLIRYSCSIHAFFYCWWAWSHITDNPAALYFFQIYSALSKHFQHFIYCLRITY